ncbi:MAG: DUF5814 domain-containing protein [Haloferacaceae archaeon]
MAITDKIYLKNHRQIASQLDANLPRSAFAGATLELVYAGEGLATLDDATQERLLGFAEDFMDCDADEIYAGYPERRFVEYLLELRTQGLGPEAIVDVMGDDYMLYAYPGDVRSFLDDAIRTLEATAALADVEGDVETARRARETRDALVG